VNTIGPSEVDAGQPRNPTLAISIALSPAEVLALSRHHANEDVAARECSIAQARYDQLARRTQALLESILAKHGRKAEAGQEWTTREQGDNVYLECPDGEEAPDEPSSDAD
jgi:hypothetical protein